MDSPNTSGIIIGPQFPDRVIPLISAANHSIDIIVFDWRIYPRDTNSSVQRFTNAIYSAAARGVTVRAIVNNDSLSTTLRQNKIRTARLYQQGLVHAKLLLFDRTLAVLGSHNFSQGAFTTNLEVSCIITLPSESNELSNYFDRLWPL